MRRGETRAAAVGGRLVCAQWQNVLMLDFTPLAKVVATLASALQETAQRAADLLARDGCIQRFEYTYELCVKSLRRQLEDMADSPGEIDGLGYKDMMRVAVERGLIADAVLWFGFRQLRNTTSHAYDPDKAAQVFSGIPSFLVQAQLLLDRLKLVGGNSAHASEEVVSKSVRRP
jgi:nucleotidyltransferase substrate binding protein (TIGR01987 family)